VLPCIWQDLEQAGYELGVSETGSSTIRVECSMRGEMVNRVITETPALPAAGNRVYRARKMPGWVGCMVNAGLFQWRMVRIMAALGSRNATRIWTNSGSLTNNNSNKKK